MKKGVTINIDENRITIVNEWGKKPIRIHNEYYNIASPYLSWENASYAYARANEEEADDYLLDHAIQDNKKLCVSVYTKDPKSIEEHFKRLPNCDTYVRKLKSDIHSDYSIVFAVRKGCLLDFYDMDKIEDLVLDWGYKIGKLVVSESVPLIDFVTGKFEWDLVPFNMYLDTERPEADPVLSSLGRTALIITGLMFGYPLAMIHEAMRSC